MNTKKWIVCMFAFCMFFSCEEEIKLPGKNEKQIVISGILIPDQLVEIRLQSNFGFREEPKEIPIENAKIELFENEASVGILNYQSEGYYRLAFKPSEGKTYLMKVSAEGFPSVEATTTIPIPCQVSVSTGIDVEYNVSGEKRELQRISLELGAEPSNAYYALTYFYKTKIYESWPPDENKAYYSYQTFPLRAKLDQIVEFFSTQQYSGAEPSSQLFYKSKSPSAGDKLKTYFGEDDDKSFGPKSIVFFSNNTFRNLRYTFSNQGGDWGSNNQVVLVLFYQLSSELYLTLRGVAAQESTNRNQFVSPVAVTSNVKNGLGYFGSCIVHRIQLYN